MKVPRTRIARIIAERALNGEKISDLSREVAAYLISVGRVRDLESVLRDVQADWASAGRLEVIARSAHPLTATVKADIETQVRKLYPNAKAVVINEVSDQAIIGGVRLQLANQQLDMSVEAKINKFKQLVEAQ